MEGSLANDDGTTLAPEGHIWVCLACGKTSKTQFGFDKDNQNVAMQGWDESCMLNARLIPESRIIERGPGGRVTKIDVTEEPGDPVMQQTKTAHAPDPLAGPGTTGPS